MHNIAPQAFARCRRSGTSSFSSSPLRYPATNASPAPTVSTTSTAKPGPSTTSPDAMHGGSVGPVLHHDLAAAAADQAIGGVGGVAVREQQPQFVGAPEDEVGVLGDLAQQRARDVGRCQRRPVVHVEADPDTGGPRASRRRPASSLAHCRTAAR